MVIRTGEIVVHIAPKEIAVIEHIAAMAGMYQKLGFLECLFGIDNGIERLVIHLDQVQGILRDVGVICYDNCDPFAHIAGHADRQGIPLNLRQLQA